MIETLLALRRRWGLLATIALVNLGLSSLALTPWSQAVRSGGLSAFPDPDAALFAQGGLIFVEWLRLERAALLGALQASHRLAGVAALVGLLPAALLTVGLADADSARLSAARHGRRALAVVPAFSVLFGATLACQAVFVLLSALFWELCMGASQPGAYPWLTLGFGLLILLSLGLPSLVQDLTRAVIVERGSRVLGALSAAFRLFANAPFRVLAAYSIPALLGWLVAAASLSLTARLARLQPSELADWANFALHQACILLLVALRAYWLHRALQLVRSS